MIFDEDAAMREIERAKQQLLASQVNEAKRKRNKKATEKFRRYLNVDPVSQTKQEEDLEDGEIESSQIDLLVCNSERFFGQSRRESQSYIEGDSDHSNYKSSRVQFDSK